MTWQKTRADRERDARVYGSQYRKNQKIIRRRSGGRCEKPGCGSMVNVQTDAKIPECQGGSHQLDNLWDLCGYHHRQKTAREGGGWRKTASDPAPAVRTQW